MNKAFQNKRVRNAPPPPFTRGHPWKNILQIKQAKEWERTLSWDLEAGKLQSMERILLQN